jgi:hypothetical protein
LVFTASSFKRFQQSDLNKINQLRVRKIGSLLKYAANSGRRAKPAPPSENKPAPIQAKPTPPPAVPEAPTAPKVKPPPAAEKPVPEKPSDKKPPPKNPEKKRDKDKPEDKPQ